MSTESGRSGVTRWYQTPDLTWLIFRASARYLAPSSPILLLSRPRVVRVYGEWQKHRITWEQTSDLTWLTFSASARYLAASSPTLSSARWSAVRVCREWTRQWDQRGAYAWTHLIHFQCFSHIFHSCSTDPVVAEMECCEGLRRVAEVMRSDRNIFDELTRLIFSASATYLNPSVSIMFPARWSVVRVYEKHQRRCDQMGACAWTHLVDF